MCESVCVAGMHDAVGGVVGKLCVPFSIIYHLHGCSLTLFCCCWLSLICVRTFGPKRILMRTNVVT